MKMKKVVRIRILFLLVAMLFTGMGKLCAQGYIHYNAGLLFVQTGQLDSAMLELNLLMKEPDAEKSGDNQYLKGVIYKEMYKKNETTNALSPSRDKAVEAFSLSMKLDTTPEHQKTIRDNLHFIAFKYYNDAVSNLDTLHYQTSLICYKKFREIVQISDVGYDVKSKDVIFYVALATNYYAIFNADKIANARFFDMTKETYLNVLTWDPNNYTANYNLGLLFWNKGVDLMYAIDYDINLDSAMDVQDFSVALFKASLPFAEKAYQIAPKREETLVVLSGIYYSLNEFQKSKAYQQMLEDLRKQGQ